MATRTSRVFSHWRLFSILIFPVFNHSWAQINNENCGGLNNGSNGPFDYRTERGQKLKIVEEYHFTANIESLVRGNSASLGGELNYTLSAFPNHHRALLAFERLAEKSGASRPSGAKYDVECYFLRAINFRPDDTASRMIYSNYLLKKNRPTEATHQLYEAIKHAGENASVHYNAGLIFLKMKNYEQARLQAMKAESLGLAQTGLRENLTSLGQWETRAATSPIDPSRLE